MGLGAVGGVTFTQLAKLGVGRLFGFDPDRYGDESWITQPALLEQTGQLKAHVQGRLAAQANPWAKVTTAPAFAQDVPLAVLTQADVIVLAGDNLELLVWAGEFAAGLGKVVVQGAVFGANQHAIVRGFNLSDHNAACPTCQLSEDDWSRMTSRLGCDPATLRLQGITPTQTLPHICATAGQMTAAEVVKWLLGQHDLALSGSEVQYNLLAHRALRTVLPRKAACRAPHRRWRVVDVQQELAHVNLADLAPRTCVTHDCEGLSSWQVHAELPWLTRAACWSCGQVYPIRRFSRLGRKVATCACGGAVWSDLDGRRSIIPNEELAAVWKTPLKKLGLRKGDSVALSRQEDRTWFVLS
jgi:hypothetical protein